MEIVKKRAFSWRFSEPLPFQRALIEIERTRRLLPLVVAHWGMDLFGQLFTLAWFSVTWW